MLIQKNFILSVLFFFSASVFALTDTLKNTELQNIITNIQRMKGDKTSKQNAQKAFKGMTSWTLLDNLKRHKNECGINDKVGYTGFNAMAHKILDNKSGILNVKNIYNSLTDSGTKRFYIVELTAKANTSVEYSIDTNAGYHTFVIVPYDGNPQRNIVDIKVEDEDYTIKYSQHSGAEYVDIEDRISILDTVHLTLHNNTNKNKSFIVIDYIN